MSLTSRLCKLCQKSFVPNYSWNKGVYCSRLCRNTAGGLVRGGKKIRSNKLDAIHKWMADNYGRTRICEDCGSNSNVWWANLDGKYSRERSTWKELCTVCHFHLDRKLSYKDVEIIRREYKGWGKGITQQALADRFGVSRSHISGVIHGKYWKEVA